jgi:histidine triad (HIT) family protein
VSAIDPNCLFCSIVTGALAATIVASTPDAVAFEDISPGAPVHVLVVPREHIPDVASLGPDSGPVLAGLVELANAVARDRGIAQSGYRLVFNVGGDAGQSVYHLHLHLLGGRRLEWPPG